MATEPHPASSAATPSEADREPLLAAFVGQNWERHYRESFAALGASRSPWRGSWNWAAAVVPFWLTARRLLVHQVAAGFVWVALFVALTLLFGESPFLLPAAVVALLAVAAGEGFWGDRWLLARARQAVHAAMRQGADHSRMQADAKKRGGVSIGLAALLVLGLVIVFVASMPRSFVDTSEKMHKSIMMSELRNLVAAEASYFGKHGTYTARLGDSVRSVTDSSPGEPLDVLVTTGVTLEVTLLSGTGYYATARYQGTDWICQVWVGAAPPELRDTPEGRPMCR